MLAAPVMTDLSLTYAVAAGSVCGRDHRRIGRNNQDAWAVEARPDAVVAVVADGCGSGAASEVGARLGSRLLAAAIQERLGRRLAGGQRHTEVDLEGILESAALETLTAIDHVARRMGGDYVTTLAGHFLFTVLGAVIHPETTYLFALGDGLLGVNGALRTLSCAGNAPPYLTYTLIPEAVRDLDLVRGLDVVLKAPTRHVCSVVLATDGAGDVSELAALSEDPRLAANPQTLQRRLTLRNRERTRIDWDNRLVHKETGALADDTTVLVLQRRHPAPGDP